jgi:hypothetical protein
MAYVAEMACEEVSEAPAERWGEGTTVDVSQGGEW